MSLPSASGGTTRKRIAAFAPNVTGGGGGTSIPTIQWTPDGEVNAPRCGVQNSMTQLGLTRNQSVGTQIQFGTPLIESASKNVGVQLTMALAESNNQSVGNQIQFPALAMVNSNNVGCQVTMSLDLITDSKQVGVQLTGSVLGAPFYQTTGTFDSTASTTSVVIPVPTGIALGDLLVVFVGQAGTTAPAVTGPSGWTKLTTAGPTATTIAQLDAFWKIATSTEVSASTFTFTLATSTGCFGSCHRINGTDPTTPINVSGVSTGSATSPISPSVTTTATNCLILIACCQFEALDVTYTEPSPFVERSEQNALGIGSAHSGDGASASRIVSASGATGTFTFTGTGLTATNYATQTIAIKPGTLTLA